MSRDDDKRPTDRLRESALSMQIGTPEDGAVSVMIDMLARYAGHFVIGRDLEVY